MGCANPEGATGRNIARQIAIRAGCPVTTAGVTVNRFCSSGLQAIATAAQRVIVDKVPVVVAGGVESISCVQNEMNQHMVHDEWLERHKPAIYMPMLQTAEVVAKRYGIGRERQDEFGVQSQQRAAAARDAGRYDKEIFPITVRMQKADKDSGKSWRGAFNITHGATMGGHALRHAMERAHLDPSEVEDVIMGCANPEGATGRNIARQIAIRAGCPVTTSGMTAVSYTHLTLPTILRV